MNRAQKREEFRTCSESQVFVSSALTLAATKVEDSAPQALSAFGVIFPQRIHSLSRAPAATATGRITVSRSVRPTVRKQSGRHWDELGGLFAREVDAVAVIQNRASLRCCFGASQVIDAAYARCSNRRERSLTRIGIWAPFAHCARVPLLRRKTSYTTKRPLATLIDRLNFR